MKTISVDDVSQYLTCLSRIWKDIGYDEKSVLMYRGHGDVNYVLLPTLLRQKTNISEGDECHHAELEYPQEFDRHHHLSTLVKMRHYSGNTRLLDLSRNPLVALYFACSSVSTKDKTGEVLVFKEECKSIKRHGSDAILVKSCLSFIRDEDREVLFRYCKCNANTILRERSSDARVNRAIHHLYHEIRSEYPTFEYEILADDLLKMHFVAANKDNERMRAQDGMFAFFGLDAQRCRCELENKVVLKIDIPSVRKKNILKELEMLRINDSIIYPGVERTLLDANKKILNQERKY